MCGCLNCFLGEVPDKVVKIIQKTTRKLLSPILNSNYIKRKKKDTILSVALV